MDFKPDDIDRVEAYRASKQVALLAIAFSDIVGYTQLCERLPEHELEPLRRDFDTLTARRVEAERQGLIVKRIGDAILSVFAEPTSAVLATLELHEDVASRDVGGQRIGLRSGIHLGQVALERKGVHVDVFGRHVNRAARVQAAAHPGEVLVTDAVADNVHGWVGSIDRQVAFSGRRTAMLKGIDEPLTLFSASLCEAGQAAHAPLAELPRIHVVLRVTSIGRPDQVLVFDAERDRRVIIGRDPKCDVPLATDAASRKHAMISFAGDGRWVINDLGSANGCYVDGARVSSGPLAAGDRIRIGDCEIVVEKLAP